jgi:hypothetical protein
MKKFFRRFLPLTVSPFLQLKIRCLIPVWHERRA